MDITEKPTEHDYPEDYSDDNGQYMHECLSCKHTFFGHKHRPATCKKCQRRKNALTSILPQD